MKETHNRRTIAFQLLPVVIVAGLIVAGLVMDHSGHLRTTLGFFTAGVAIAMSRLLTAFAAFFVILTSRAFRVGDRIVLGGVRGDVVKLGYIRTTILEMGQPPPVQSADPAMWVEARQYTGRIVTITNDKIFDQPVYNFTREFPFLWEEMRVGISYAADRSRAEQVLLDAVGKYARPLQDIAEEDMLELRRRYFVAEADLEPRVFYRMTDNWLELAVRFVVPTHGIREIKDGISRAVVSEFERAGLSIASATYDIVGLPTVRVELRNPESRTEAGRERRI